jgi:hypothetical protein
MIELGKIVTYLVLVVTSGSGTPDLQGTYQYTAYDIATCIEGTVYCRTPHQVGDTLRVPIERPQVARKVPVKN